MGIKVRKRDTDYDTEWETEREVEVNKTSTRQDGCHKENETLDSICEVVGEVVASGMATLRAKLKKDFSDFRAYFRDDKQMGDFTMEMNRSIQEVTDQIAGVVKQVGEMEENMADMERWDIGVKNVLTQLIANQRALQEKVSDLEGRSRHNNIRVYGIPEGAKGTSVVAFIENFLKVELGPQP